MTAPELAAAILPLIEDLGREISPSIRYQRLLRAVRELVPCDAVALLRLEHDQLVPLAVEGLPEEVMGRRFRLDDHPRMNAFMHNPGSLRFSADCPLPDPYDGLLDCSSQGLPVHDCMGGPIRIGTRPWGLVTLDSLHNARFHARDVQRLDLVLKLAGPLLDGGDRIDTLHRRIEDQHQLAERYLEVASHLEAPILNGHSAAYKSLIADIALVAGSELTALISGESGVGKELVAQAIHTQSPRRQKPLVSVNCAALPEALAESELFGHVRGAFSGAVGKRSGKFELADGGTLFLDEVGELPQNVQAKLLRVLQSGQIQRVGSDQELRVNVRVIAATNRDLAEEVRKGRFRADLYHRLSVYPLRVPPLRDRGRDVLILAGGFLEQNRSRLRLRSLRLTSESQAALLAYQWPGNVRELEHLIGRAALKARSAAQSTSAVVSIGPEHLDLPTSRPVIVAPSAESSEMTIEGDLRSAIDRYQTRLISSTLARHEGNWAATARALGLDRGNLYRLAIRLGITEPPKARRKPSARR